MAGDSGSTYMAGGPMKGELFDRVRLGTNRAWYRRVGRHIDRGFEGRICWLLGPPRSGSSWLLGLLGGHPRVLPIDEPLLGHYLSPFLADLPGFDVSGLDEETFTLRRAFREREDEFFSDRYRAAWEPLLSKLVRRRFQAQLAARAVDPSRTFPLIKEPNGSQSADLILGATPRSRVLFLYRDPRDSIDSELSANRPGAWTTRIFPGAEGITEMERTSVARLAAHKWLMRVEIVEDALRRHPGPTMTIRYEDLVANPERHLEGVLTWIGLTASADEVRQRVEGLAFGALPRTGEGEFARRGRAGSWRGSLSADEVKVIDEITASKRGNLGYAD